MFQNHTNIYIKSISEVMSFFLKKRYIYWTYKWSKFLKMVYWYSFVDVIYMAWKAPWNASSGIFFRTRFTRTWISEMDFKYSSFQIPASREKKMSVATKSEL